MTGPTTRRDGRRPTGAAGGHALAGGDGDRDARRPPRLVPDRRGGLRPGCDRFRQRFTGLPGGCRRRRHLRLRRRRLLRFDGGHRAQPTGRRHGRDPGRPWLLGGRPDGGIFAFGDAGFYGSMGGTALNQPVVGMAATPDGSGYWEVALTAASSPSATPVLRLERWLPGDVRRVDQGDHRHPGRQGLLGGRGRRLDLRLRRRRHFGSAAGFTLAANGSDGNASVRGLTATPDGRGYWEVAHDGGIFAFGDAGFYGSMGGAPLHAGIVDVAATPDGRGYWEVGNDGGIFAFGDADFHGSTGGVALNAAIVGMA